MSIKQLSFLTAVGAIAIGTATSALAETNTPSQVTFYCEVSDNGVPTTILKSADTQKTIFNWQGESLSEQNPVDLCNKVTSELNSYVTDENNDLSVLTFKGDVQADYLPAICVTDNPDNCNKVLFTLSSAEKPGNVANTVLGEILEPNLQTTKLVSETRGLQSVSYSVNIWELIVGRKLSKSF